MSAIIERSNVQSNAKLCVNSIEKEARYHRENF